MDEKLQQVFVRRFRYSISIGRKVAVVKIEEVGIGMIKNFRHLHRF